MTDHNDTLALLGQAVEGLTAAQDALSEIENTDEDEANRCSSYLGARFADFVGDLHQSATRD
jgi:hypothetical protein